MTGAVNAGIFLFSVLFFSAVFTGCSSPEADSYGKEADRFLQNMPSGLQERQHKAILSAMEGDFPSLSAVRKARNTVPDLPSNVTVSDIASHLRLYVPENRKPDTPLPLLVYLHGGGWTIGSLNSCARYCSEVAASGKVMVLAVDYRLAPEHPYPEGLQDCIAAFRYACRHAKEWGSDPALVSVGGDSSGGNLALAVTLDLLRHSECPPHSLVLFYPVVSSWNDATASWKEYSSGAALDGLLMEAFNAAYCDSTAAHSDPLISPSLAADQELSALPRILFIAADRDILRDQGRAFAERLQRCRVKTEYHLFPGSVHLFITVPGQNSAFTESVRLTAAFLSTTALQG